MKKKVIGFFILLLVLLLGLSTSCFAYTWEDIDEFNNQLLDNSSVNQITKNYIGVYNSNKQKFKNFLSNNNLDIEDFTGVTFSGNSTTRVNMHFQRNTTEITKTSTSISASHCYNLAISRNSGAVYLSSSDLDIIMWSQTNPELYWGLTNGSYDQIFESNQYFDNYYTPISSIEFEPYNDGFITVYNNGSGESFLKYKLSRSVNSWALGKLDGLDDSMRVDARLSFFIPGTENYTSSIGHAQMYYGQSSSSGGLSITSDGVVYINNSNIYYEQGYNLSVDLEGETLGNYYLYFLPYGSNKVSGDLYSPDLDSNEYLDIVQNLQELISIVNVNNIYDENFSGDSGDVLLGTLDYKEYNNDYNDYLSTSFMALRNSLLGSGDVAFSFNFMGNNMTVHSDQYFVPDGVLKFFVTSFLVFATIYYLYVQVSHFFHKLQEGDLESALETYSINDESVLM